MAVDQGDWRHPSGLPGGRTLHLIDAENLVGTGQPADGEVEEALDLYRRLICPREGDHVVIAANGATAATAGWAWPGVLVRTARGPDGADRALLKEMEVCDVAGRYDRVVVASGDHAFAEAARDLRDAGVRVEVVSCTDRLAAVLRAAATTVRHLPVRQPSAAAAA